MFTEIELLPLPWLFQIEQSLPIYGGPFFLVQRGHKEENSTTSTWATAKKNICCVRINHPWCEISCDQHKRAQTSNILTTRLHSCLHGAKSTAEHQVSHKQNYAKHCKTTIKAKCLVPVPQRTLLNGVEGLINRPPNHWRKKSMECQ